MASSSMASSSQTALINAAVEIKIRAPPPQAKAIEEMILKWFPKGVKISHLWSRSDPKMEVTVNERVVVSVMLTYLEQQDEDNKPGLLPTQKAAIRSAVKNELETASEESQNLESVVDVKLAFSEQDSFKYVTNVLLALCAVYCFARGIGYVVDTLMTLYQGED
eukprot:TRINITY_DN42001_c0_g1_i1.p1 TRINITY_DN42001_c0_g1~~TRINITY_DN42001_c0_g1_i1.p1  ORF type:complete len:181 (-),score=34.81 TRINITY_DN42001_c0_g1_i1:111-602(-)